MEEPTLDDKSDFQSEKSEIDMTDLESTDMPDSLFESDPSTPTDVTSLWGDFPADAEEAFADALVMGSKFGVTI
jgi:hypothetical protein